MEGRPGTPREVWTTAQPAITYRRPVGRYELPESFVRDPDRFELHLGQGVFGPVSQEMRDYRVSGQNVLDGWLNAGRDRRPAEPSASLTTSGPSSGYLRGVGNSSTCWPSFGVWSGCSLLRTSCSAVFSWRRWSVSTSCSVGTCCRPGHRPSFRSHTDTGRPHPPGPRGSRRVSRTP